MEMLAEDVTVIAEAVADDRYGQDLALRTKRYLVESGIDC
jgi:hypothetical protein